jgi:hypothetical protein
MITNPTAKIITNPTAASKLTNPTPAKTITNPTRASTKNEPPTRRPVISWPFPIFPIISKYFKPG